MVHNLYYMWCIFIGWMDEWWMDGFKKTHNIDQSREGAGGTKQTKKQQQHNKTHCVWSRSFPKSMLVFKLPRKQTDLFIDVCSTMYTTNPATGASFLSFFFFKNWPFAKPHPHSYAYFTVCIRTLHHLSVENCA